MVGLWTKRGKGRIVKLTIDRARDELYGRLLGADLVVFCRMNLFYDNSHCLSLDCLESEDDVRELITRMQAVAPRLTASHEVGGERKGVEGGRELSEWVGG